MLLILMEEYYWMLCSGRFYSNKKRAVRVPKTGYRQDSSAAYRKGNEYLIVRPDNSGVEKIVTYGVNDD